MSKRKAIIVYEENLYSVSLRGDIWYAQFKDPNSGKYLPRRSLKIRASLGNTRNHAEKRADEVWKSGIVDELTARNSSKDSVYFEGYCKEFFSVGGRYHNYRISEGKTLKESTLDGYRGNLELYIAPFFANKLLKRITRKDVLAFRSYLLVEKKLDQNSAKNILKNFKAVIKFALHEEKISSDPTSDISVAVPRKQRVGILTDAEIKKLRTCKWKDPRTRLATLLASTTGARRGEVLALKWEDICFDDGRLYIRHSWNSEYGLTTTKTGDERENYIAKDLLEELKLYKKLSPCSSDDDYVFPSTPSGSRPLDTKRLDNDFHEALREIGISESERKKRRITFHNLRHRLITTLHERGVSPLTIRKLVGHSDDRIEYQYFHGKGDEVISIIEEIYTDVL